MFLTILFWFSYQGMEHVLPWVQTQIYLSTRGGGQKHKKSEFCLAEKLPPFSLLSWFQKYKNQLWTPTGSAASEKSLLSSGLLKLKIKRKQEIGRISFI